MWIMSISSQLVRIDNIRDIERCLQLVDSLNKQHQLRRDSVQRVCNASRRFSQSYSRVVVDSTVLVFQAGANWHIVSTLVIIMRDVGHGS